MRQWCVRVCACMCVRLQTCAHRRVCPMRCGQRSLKCALKKNQTFFFPPLWRHTQGWCHVQDRQYHPMPREGDRSLIKATIVGAASSNIMNSSRQVSMSVFLYAWRCHEFIAIDEQNALSIFRFTIMILTIKTICSSKYSHFWITTDSETREGVLAAVGWEQ